MNFYQFLIPRLNGNEIEKKFDYYLRLVKKGIAGFIIFGGNLETVRKGISELQKETAEPLIISSDLEQGLGQQIKEGTLFPPAMAVASAVKPPSLALPLKGGGVGGGGVQNPGLNLLRRAFKAIALEAQYAGINTIFAPVLDINTNPRNPIISTRSFGEDPETVLFFGCRMIRILQGNGVAACGKHFPGHGDTEVDSHISLPLIKKELPLLENTELVPFRRAIKAGVKMIMLGHLSVPAIDPSGIPVSLSEKAIRYLKDKMEFRGITITDALNMHGLKSVHNLTEEKASLMALGAGVDFLLHPTEPDSIVSHLEKNDYQPSLSTINRLRRFRRTYCSNVTHAEPSFSFEEHKKLSEELTRKAINLKGEIRPIKKPSLIVLNDEEEEKGSVFIEELLFKKPELRYLSLKRQMKGIDSQLRNNTIGKDIIVAVFSKIKAWKGGVTPWIEDTMKELGERTRIAISFGSPHILDSLKDDIIKIYAYWDSEVAQKTVAELIVKNMK
ncbi:MAG: glycoside hydrolase family 3 protein [Nitrospira sp.]|nr:glycoside hydrolase family 3 protein [Nitrospira sp.]